MCRKPHVVCVAGVGGLMRFSKVVTGRCCALAQPCYNSCQLHPEQL